MATKGSRRTGGDTNARGITTSRKDRLPTLPDDFLHCRLNLHAMDPEGIYTWIDDDGGRYEVLLNRCLRCGTVGEDFFLDGERAFPRAYVNPPGYLLRKSKVVDDPHLRKADYFEEFSRRNRKRYGNRESLLRAKGIVIPESNGQE